MRRLCPIIMLCLCISAAPAPKRPRPGPAQNADINYVTNLLTAGDKDSVREAVQCIAELFEMQPAAAVTQFRSSWMNSLIVAGRYDDAQHLAIAAMIEVAGEPQTLEELQKLRIKAYQSAGRPGEALAAARTLYDICSMGSTRAALLQLAECLSAAHPDDPSFVNRLRREQMAGAQADDGGCETISAIPVDPAPWQTGLKRYDPDRYAIASNVYRNLTARGNLLLLSGRAAEAREVFERAKPLADDDLQLQANENIARAIKAQFSCIGPANRFIRQLKP